MTRQETNEFLSGDKMKIRMEHAEYRIPRGSLFQIEGDTTLKDLGPITVELADKTRRSLSDDRRDLAGMYDWRRLDRYEGVPV